MVTKPSARSVDADREHELLRRYHEQGDLAARAELAELMLPLARSLAGRYAGRQEPMEDLVQVACIGILKAIDGFDLSADARFSSYAVPTALGEIKRHFRDRTWAVRPPRGVQETQMLVAKARDRLSAQLGRSPTVGELAEAVSLPEEEVLEAIEASHARYSNSLLEPNAEGLTLADRLGVTDPELAIAETRALLDRAMHVLAARDQKILQLRFERDLTQQEIATMMGVSQMQISRIIRQSLDRLRLEIERRPQLEERRGDLVAA